MHRLIEHLTARPKQLYALVGCAVFLLPVALWLDLNSLSHHNLHRQATSLNKLMNDVRSYYAENVVARVQAAPNAPEARHDYHDIEGAFPIPATAAIELSARFSEILPGVDYHFVSDHPFSGRTQRHMTTFEAQALEAFRDPDNERDRIIAEEGGLLDHRMTLAARSTCKTPV